MADLIVSKTEILTLEQSPLGQRYARRAAEHLREQPGSVIMTEDTQKITVKHTCIFGLDVADDDLLREANFEL